MCRATILIQDLPLMLKQVLLAQIKPDLEAIALLDKTRTSSRVNPDRPGKKEKTDHPVIQKTLPLIRKVDAFDTIGFMYLPWGMPA